MKQHELNYNNNIHLYLLPRHTHFLEEVIRWVVDRLSLLLLVPTVNDNEGVHAVLTDDGVVIVETFAELLDEDVETDVSTTMGTSIT